MEFKRFNSTTTLECICQPTERVFFSDVKENTVTATQLPHIHVTNSNLFSNMFFHINRIDNKPPKCFKKKKHFFLHNRVFSANGARDRGDPTVDRVLGVGVPVESDSHQVAVPLLQEDSGHGVVDANVVRGPLGVGRDDTAVLGHPVWRALVLATNVDEDGGAAGNGADGAEERDGGLLVLLEGDNVDHQLRVLERAVSVDWLVGKAEDVGDAILHGAGVCRASSVEYYLVSWADVQTPVSEGHHCVCFFFFLEGERKVYCF